MTFRSILLESDTSSEVDGTDPNKLAEPDFFSDLNVDQIVASITAGQAQYDLPPFFYVPLHEPAAVVYRHAVFRDLQCAPISAAITAFTNAMQDMRAHLTQIEKLYYILPKRAWFADAVRVYCRAVTTLADDLTGADVHSQGLREFRDYVTTYVASPAFIALCSDTDGVRADLAGIRYRLHLKGNHITVAAYDDEDDYSEQVLRTFAKFKQGVVRDYRVDFRPTPDLNHVEAAVLDLVSRLYPAVFARLEHYCAQHRNYLDAVIARFDREIHFYIAYLDYIRPLERAGLPFCFPEVSTESKQVRAVDTFDLALAGKLVDADQPVVCNEFHLTDPERIIVVSGPNNGGKTTLARTFGQLHYLGALGLPVPGREAALYLFDQLFTHFERAEDMTNLRGKLQDDLVRIHDILQRASKKSVLIMNEIFTSTTLDDAVFLSKEVLGRVIELDLVCVCVTFLDELSSLSETTVSMVSTVVPEDPAVRTFKVMRQPADGLAYAAAIAEKYRLTYAEIGRRIAS